MTVDPQPFLSDMRTAKYSMRSQPPPHILTRMKYVCAALMFLLGCRTSVSRDAFTLNYDTSTDAALQTRLEEIDARLRAKYGMSSEQTDVGVLDLRRPRLAMIHPDQIEYAASVAKVG